MAGFTLDTSQNTTATAEGGITGALAGAGTGAAIGAPIGGYGALVGAGIGAIVGALGGGAVSNMEDTQAQKDAYKQSQDEAATAQNAKITASTQAREAGSKGATAYMGAYSSPTGYDQWKNL